MGDWKRVSRRFRCPVCNKADWCGYIGPDGDPAAVLCMRIENNKPAKSGGWLHILRDDGPLWAPWRATVHIAAKQLQPDVSAGDIEKTAEVAAAGTPDETLARLAAELGVSVSSLRRLSVGWLQGRKVWGFPMRNARGRVTGIRLRYPDGRKLSIRGGKEGLFLPDDLQPGGRLLIAEGPSDCAALLDLGFDAIGRPSCTGGTQHIVALVKKLRPNDIIIVADDDGPGQRGAGRLAAVLLAYVPSVRIITPPAKDAREWKRSGATASGVNALIEVAPAKSLKIRVSPSNKTPSLHPIG